MTRAAADLFSGGREASFSSRAVGIRAVGGTGLLAARASGKNLLEEETTMNDADIFTQPWPRVLMPLAPEEGIR